MQRQAGIVGVLQSVLKLHLHCQTPTMAANHIRLLSVERTQRKLTETKQLSRCLILLHCCRKTEDRTVKSEPCPRDVHVCLQHQVCCTYIILATVFEEWDLVGVGGRESMFGCWKET